MQLAINDRMIFMTMLVGFYASTESEAILGYLPCDCIIQAIFLSRLNINITLVGSLTDEDPHHSCKTDNCSDNIACI